ncbi:MAG: DinB family protein [Gemmatimonadetes bacterium]|nr:DinB family protein [Gemmatimonadota bacterium]
MNTESMKALISVWEEEHQKTMNVLKFLPSDMYDFRPDPEGRSLGELAWHMAEHEGYLAHAAAVGNFDPNASLPELKRPTSVPALAPAFDEVHALAVARVEDLSPKQMKVMITIGDEPEKSIENALWTRMLFGVIHHRGQLSILVRHAKGTVPPIYGPNREQRPLRTALV